jgi:hypothetical protein
VRRSLVVELGFFGPFARKHALPGGGCNIVWRHRDTPFDAPYASSWLICFRRVVGWSINLG